MSALTLSVLVSLVSAVAYAGGAIVQQRVAVSSSASARRFATLRRPVWWAAIALNGAGALLHVVALACGPLSLVQPLGALTIVFALPMAALFAGRRAGAAAWRGAITASAGLAGLLALVGASPAQSPGAAQRLGLAAVAGTAVAALAVAGRAAHRRPAVRSVLLATGSGVAFGVSSVFTKTVAVDWTDGLTAADVPSFAVIAVLAAAGTALSQASYRGGGLAAPLATLTVLNPVVAAAIGVTLLGESFRHGSAGTVLALGCGAVATGGLVLLTTERLTPAPEKAAPEAAVAAVPAPRVSPESAGAAYARSASAITGDSGGSQGAGHAEGAASPTGLERRLTAPSGERPTDAAAVRRSVSAAAVVRSVSAADAVRSVSAADVARSVSAADAVRSVSAADVARSVSGAAVVRERAFAAGSAAEPAVSWIGRGASGGGSGGSGFVGDAFVVRAFHGEVLPEGTLSYGVWHAGAFGGGVIGGGPSPSVPYLPAPVDGRRRVRVRARVRS
ncbi:DMT family transporter [Streptomyces sp. NPDC046985]|uniref:DMT family transporter n=1 Tax=Streptomyces sp. NPDC046985 TaxID=3155377 RepID=UPI0033E9695E